MHLEKYLILKKVKFKSYFLLSVINFNGEKSTLKSSQSYLNPGFIIEKTDKDFYVIWSPKKISFSLDTFYIFHFYLEFIEKIPFIEPHFMSLFLKALFLLDEEPHQGTHQLFLFLSKALQHLQLFSQDKLSHFYLQGRTHSLSHAHKSQWKKEELLYCYQQLKNSFSFQSLPFLQNLFSI